MAKVKEFVKHGLFNYPSIYPSPLDVIIAAFTAGYRWTKDGEIGFEPEVAGHKPSTEMIYDEPFKAKYDVPYLHSLNTTHRLEKDAERTRREWIANNIDAILDGKMVASYFKSDNRPSVLRDISSSCEAFNPPDNITEEWKEVLLDFLKFLLWQSNVVYGCHGEARDYYKDWPESAQKIRQKIVDTIEVLYPGHWMMQRKIAQDIGKKLEEANND